MIYIGNKLVAEENNESIVKWPDEDSGIDAQSKLLIGINSGKMIDIPNLPNMNSDQIWYIKSVALNMCEWASLPITEADIGKYLGVGQDGKLTWSEL